jgi:hypothetical protein
MYLVLLSLILLFLVDFFKSKIMIIIISIMMVFGVLMICLSNIPFLPRQNSFIVRNIIPIENDLDPNELFYYWDDDTECIFYIKDINGNKVEVKVPSNSYKINEPCTCNKYATVLIKYTELTPFWEIFIGNSKPINTSVEFNIPK